jgi:Leucine-rich repeat (LRR) protein
VIHYFLLANQGGNMNKASFCFLIIILWQLSNFVFGAIPASERAALIALYNSTNGDNWYYNKGWKTPPLHTDGFAMPGTEEYWHGVVLSGDNVSRIFLEDNYLNGSIPPELGNLSNLKSLWLVGNQLSGSIPPQLGNLSNLGDIHLNINQLSGSIPSELGNLSNLLYLHLSDNQLSGSIPPELGNLSNLKSLWLVGNQLSGSIPPQLGNLSDLSGLYLRYNQLSGSIPSELGNLSNLHELYLDYNQLSGSIPPELGNLSNLHWLFLDNNRLSGSIPPEFGNLSNLFCLNLGSNQLSGSIPSNFTNLTNLSYLDVGYNCLFAADSTFISWLNSHDPDWEATQCLEKAPPFGYFETPIHNSTVCSSVAVTGWALDDYGMDSVKIYCEYENTLVFIGDAIFVEGARPDVEAAYPGYPENDRAGWGYMLLTNFLPNGGNGTYVLHAIATDRYGKTTTLGTKTIIVDNAHAVKPFGAIDTPVQGGTASGSGFVNWGWALTPAPNKIPIDGSTIDVWIDGVNIGHPTYNIYRSDIASFFPNYANSNGAVGYFYLDTTKYTNGVHTIQWTAADNAGNIDGIGSRYFAVQNNDPGSTPTAASSLPGLGRHTGQIPGRTRHTIQELALLPEEKGLNELIIKELDRVEIKLSENHGEILGYLLCSDELKKLPIGSTLDAKTGTFYWSPGLGFLGRYSLVFVLTDPDGQSYKKSIEIEIVPRFNGLWPTD